MDLLQELYNPKNYQDLFQKLRAKSQREFHRKASAPVIKEITLDWILYSEEFVTKKIIKEIKKKRYFPGLASKNIIIAQDKSREIFSMSWPDKIVESVLATALNNSLEYLYSDALFSFRKGKSNLTALGAVSDFIKTNSKQGQGIFIFRTDLSKYGETISVPVLFKMIQDSLPAQEEYLWSLLSKFLDAKYQSGLEEKIDAGLPAGFSLTPVCENIFLTDVDKVMIQSSELYLRFGDDILLASTSADMLLEQKEKLLKLLSNKGLIFHPNKTVQVALGSKESGFLNKKYFDYLGYSINAYGQLFLSENKLKTLEKYFANKLDIAFHSIRKLEPNKLNQVKFLVESIQNYFKNELRHPFLDLMLVNCNDLERLKKFDLWLARLIIRKVFKLGGDRVFRYCSYAELRAWGLPATSHLTRIRKRKAHVI